MPRRLSVAAALLSAAPAVAADRPLKEPKYPTPPGYARLSVGPTPAETVWLAVSGDTLYVDRNGNGDLTEPGEAVPATARAKGAPDDGSRTFDAGEVRVGGRVHKGLSVSVLALDTYADGDAGKRADVKALLKADPKAKVLSLSVDVDRPGLRGCGLDGRVAVSAGFLDPAGLFRPAADPAEASTVRAAGPLQVTFYGAVPTLRAGRGVDCVLVVGAPGDGPGTFAEVQYRNTIPDAAFPVVTVEYPPAKPGGPPVKELFELKKRC